MEDDLEALLKASVSEAKKRREDRARPGAVASPVSERYRMAFTDPKSWDLTSYVQLVHRDGNIETLIGLFAQYNHLYSKSTRKLVAVQFEAGMSPRIEYVTGDHWLGSRLSEKRAIGPAESVEIIEDLFLDMGVSAPAVVVKAFIVSGGVSRLCLASTTTFQGYAPRTFLTVSEGTDVLECLTKRSKERIWEEIQKALDGTL